MNNVYNQRPKQQNHLSIFVVGCYWLYELFIIIPLMYMFLCVCVRAQVLSFSFCAVSTVNQIAQVFFLSVFLFAPHKMTFPSSSMPFTMHKVENGGSTVERFSHNIIFLGLCHSKCQLKHFPTAYKKTLKKNELNFSIFPVLSTGFSSFPCSLSKKLNYEYA